MKKLLFSILFLIPFMGFSQGTFYDVSGYNVCIQLPPSYKNNPTKIYPAIIFMPGAGEIGTDKNKLVLYGPNAFVKQGWNGVVDSVEFIVASFQQKLQYSRPATDKVFFDYLYANFRVDKKNIFGTGLSRGWWHTGHYATYQKTTNDLSYITTYKGLAIYEGQAPDDKWDATLPYPTKFGRWAKLNDGYLLAVHNKNSPFYADAVVKSVNDSLPNHAWYFEPTYGNGGHGYWSEFYGGDGTQPAKYLINGKQKNVYEFFAGIVKGGTVTPPDPPNPPVNPPVQCVTKAKYDSLLNLYVLSIATAQNQLVEINNLQQQAVSLNYQISNLKLDIDARRKKLQLLYDKVKQMLQILESN